LHLVRCDAENLGDGHVVAGLQLAAETRDHALAVEAHIGIERLHRRMREIRKDIFRFDHFARALERGFGVAMRAGNQSRLSRQRTIFLDDLLAAAFLGLGFIPGDAQLLAALDRGPHALRIDRDARRYLLHVDDARNFLRLGGIEGRNLAAEARRMRDHDRQHLRLADIDGELRLAVGFVGGGKLCRRKAND